MEVPVFFAKILTALLVVTFGTSTWVALGGLWVELPLLTNLGIPEDFKIGSYVIIITQAAAIGPIMFVTAQHFAPKKYHLEIPTIYLILGIGVTASLLLIFFWDYYTIWNLDKMEHSTAMLVLTFFMSLVDSTSNLTFTPFISSLKPYYLNWYFIGEGLSSVIPSFVVLLQNEGGVDRCVENFTFTMVTNDSLGHLLIENCTEFMIEKDGEALFPPQFYYMFVFILFLLGTISFCLLRCLPLLRGQYDNFIELKERTSTTEEPSGWRCCKCLECFRPHADETEKTPLLRSHERKVSSTESMEHSEHVRTTDLGGHYLTRQHSSEEDEDILSPENQLTESTEVIHSRSKTPLELSSREGSDIEGCVDNIGQDKDASPAKSNNCSSGHVFLFVVLTIISAATYGALPQIQSYSGGGYGEDTYLLVTAFAEISVPIGFFLVMIHPLKSYHAVLLTAIGGLLSGVYCLTTATLCNSPPLGEAGVIGKIVIISVWIVQGICFSYCRATIGWILRSDHDSRTSMMWFGACTTLGTMIGAVIMFPIVNFSPAFPDCDIKEVCPNATCDLIDVTYGDTGPDLAYGHYLGNLS